MKHVCLTFRIRSEQYLVQILVTIVSILENHKHTKIVFHIIAFNEWQEYLDKIYDIIKQYQQEVVFYVHPDERIQKEIEYFINVFGKQWDESLYYRLFIPYIIKTDADRFLYVDAADIIVNHPLDKLFEIPFEGNTILASKEDILQGYVYSILAHHMVRYFNAGVFVFNLSHKEDFQIHVTKMKTIVENHLLSNLNCKDQDILNYLYKGKVKYISNTYNYRMNILNHWFDETVHIHHTSMICFKQNFMKKHNVLYQQYQRKTAYPNYTFLPLSSKLKWTKNKFIKYLKDHVMIYSIITASLDLFFSTLFTFFYVILFKWAVKGMKPTSK